MKLQNFSKPLPLLSPLANVLRPRLPGGLLGGSDSKRLVLTLLPLRLTGCLSNMAGKNFAPEHRGSLAEAEGAESKLWRETLPKEVMCGCVAPPVTLPLVRSARSHGNWP